MKMKTKTINVVIRCHKVLDESWGVVVPEGMSIADVEALIKENPTHIYDMRSELNSTETVGTIGLTYLYTKDCWE